MSRFFVNGDNITSDRIIITNHDDIKHITKVLRLSQGDKIDISDSVEFEYEAEIISLDAGCVAARILDKQRFAAEPHLHVTLFQGIPKQGKMETIIQKCTELGIHSVVPAFMDRTIVADKGNFAHKVERWQKISNESVKQCRRGAAPEIHQPVSFKGMTEMLNPFDLVLFPYENETNYTIKDCLHGLESTPDSLAIIIGPEGGFSDKEAQILNDLGAECVTLGKTILRTETAGMAALAMVMYELEL